MKATDWEFKNRAWLFGLVFGISFPLYTLDSKNCAEALGNWLAVRFGMDATIATQLVLAVATLLVMAAAFMRTWASAYLHASVVYAAQVKTAALVADGPYRQVRNPLYFGNVLMVVGIGAMMSRVGFVVAVIAMMIFNYRLIFREEADLRATQGEKYDVYTRAVPRLLPSPWPRIPSAGSQPRWADGFLAEAWCWGFAVALAVFAVTLNTKIFFALMGVSLVLFWVLPSMVGKKSGA